MKFYNREKLTPLLSGSFILLVLLAMIITHMIVFFIYSQRSKTTESKVNRDVVARQVISFIQTVQDTPSAQQQSVVNALDLPNLKVTLDHKPKYNLQLENESLWQILDKISDANTNIQLSLKLSDNRWLNISASIVPTSYALQFFLITLEVIVAIAILFSLWTISRFTTPLHKFTKAAERLGVDLHSDPLPIYGPVSVRATAYAMNKMQERIQDLIQARTQMLAAISHDLRTPITRLKLRAQYIDDINLQEKINRDLDEMEGMISETLSFSREDSRNEKRVNLDIASLLSSLCDDLEETGKAVEYHGPRDRVILYGAPLSLRRVFNNLIENACKYAGSADVYMQEKNEEVIIKVLDNGPGLPADQLEKVFMPFYRGETSRSRETGGTGLGLAVAKDFVRAHGGDIKLKQRPSGGLEVNVSLPVVKSI